MCISFLECPSQITTNSTVEISSSKISVGPCSLQRLQGNFYASSTGGSRYSSPLSLVAPGNPSFFHWWLQAFFGLWLRNSILCFHLRMAFSFLPLCVSSLMGHLSLSSGPNWVIQDYFISRSLITSAKFLFPNYVTFMRSRAWILIFPSSPCVPFQEAPAVFWMNMQRKPRV